MVDYYYNPFGRRLWKEVNGTRTYFFYSDEGLIAEYDATGNEIRSYGWQPDSTWTTDPLWLQQDGQYYWYQNDHLGTPQKLVDMAGTVVWSAQYAAFGKATIEVEAVTNHLRFPGQYYDDETGLHYNFQRYYDPRIGRYVSPDPIGFDGGDVNWYGYTGNNPVQAFDPFGLHYYPSLPPIDVRLIPGIMRKNGWEKGAQLLTRWLAFPAGGKDDTPPDTKTITMDWVLGFERAKLVYDEIIEKRIYTIEAAKYPILKVLQKYYHGGRVTAFGDFSKPLPELNDEYINQRQVAYPTSQLIADEVDELIVALGRFNLRVVLQGYAHFAQDMKNICVRVDALGIYVHDQFDFEDDPLSCNPKTWISQPLGWWNSDVEYGGFRPWKGDLVNNARFRAYRRQSGMGGDFWIFSDVKIVRLPAPEWIFIQ